MKNNNNQMSNTGNSISKNNDEIRQALNQRSRQEGIKSIYRKYGIFIIFLIMFVISTIASPNFLSVTNIVNIVRQNAAITILACGMTILIISGNIDLSGGAVLTMAGCFASGVMVATGSIPLAVLTGIAVGAFTEYINGSLITVFGLQPFIATLAMMNVAQGIVQIYTNGTAINGIGKMALLGSGYVGPIPIPIIIMAICIAVTYILLKYTKIGLYIYAIGGNAKATTASGINTNRMKRMFYVIHGCFAGIAGVVLMGRLNSAQPSLADAGYEFDAIVAVIVGGTSFSGGMGNVLGTLIGALIVGMINNVLLLLNVPTMYQYIVKGVLIAGAVIIDLKTRSNKQ